jgi:hypothetical protein
MNDQKGERCLVVGDVNPHETLFYLWLILEEKSEDPRERLKEMRAGKDALRATWRERALGGGVIGTDGKPVSWDSIHFEVSTPEEWRRILVAKLPLIVNWAFLGRPPIDDPDITLS